MVSLRRLPLVVFASAVVAGCAVEPAPETSTDAPVAPAASPAPRDSLGRPLGPISAQLVARNEGVAPVARVEVAPNELVEIYEVAPGQLAISGAGAPAGEPRFPSTAFDGLTMAEAWNLVADGAAPPPALAEAMARAPKGRMPSGAASDPMRGAPTSEPLPFTSGGGEPARMHVGETPHAAPLGASGGYCDNNYLGYGSPSWCWSGHDVTVCLKNWWGGAYAQSGNINWVYTDVCAASGPILFTVTWNGSLYGAWTVDTDTYRYFHYGPHDCSGWFSSCPSWRDDVSAPNTRFHLRAFVNHQH